MSNSERAQLSTPTTLLDFTTGNELTITATGAAKTDSSAVTQPVSAASLPLPTGAATAALQTQPGVDIGDVTINNAAGAAAVNIQDGGNSVTIDGTVTANQGTANTAANGWFVRLTDGTDNVIVDTDGSLFVKPVPIGTHGNAWNAATVSSGGNSNVIDCQYAKTISIFGNSSNNLNPIRVQASQDNINFYTLVTFSISSGNFGTTIDFGARYLRLQSGQGNNFTLTATVAGK